MTTATITYLGELHTECTHLASGTAIATDAPVDNHGRGEAFSPTDLCVTALGSCAISLMGIYAQQNNLPFANATVDVTKTMGIAPRRIVKIELVFTIPGSGYSEEIKKNIEAAAQECPMCHSLHPDITRVFTFNWV